MFAAGPVRPGGSPFSIIIHNCLICLYWADCHSHAISFPIPNNMNELHPTHLRIPGTGKNRQPIVGPPHHPVHCPVLPMELGLFQKPISIARAETKEMAKIGSNHTYVKCMNDLHRWGYIRYKTSRNPQKGSLVYLYTFDTSNMYTFDTSSVHVVHPSINNTNYLKQESVDTHPQNINPHFSISKNDDMETSEKKEKSCAKKERNLPAKTKSICRHRSSTSPSIFSRRANPSAKPKSSSTISKATVGSLEGKPR
jgi:hypothetical protein